ncbi:MAG: hypothetical protein H6Q10_754 [Acidobacteria bacterium]|jgi:hypothetical protein|nr:hypothetical protein [Acidobacteriota bacterium]
MNAERTARPPTRAWDASQLQLETLERLACGCVLAIQRMRPSGVTAVSVEAKGPHCTYRAHRPNLLIRLGEPVDPFDGDPSPYDEPALPA